ncbi:hypothetical protein [Flavobacterium gelatinilyticum]|uniref:hypothetical protein n=1 Tax=Flavobacterium gelatinilyticum TaxID=3003260 RepID=UPI00247FD81D|nr:hypothetical protein [Flavobacterium gelatinilyticum]
MYTGKIFSGKGSIIEYLRSKVQKIHSELDLVSENYLLNVSEEQYAEYIVSENSIEEPVIHFDDVYADHYEKEILASFFPPNFDVYYGEKYKRKIIQFFIPVTGDYELLKYKPAVNNMVFDDEGTNFEVEKGKLKLEIIDFYDDPQHIKDIYDENVLQSNEKFSILKKNIADFNNSMNSYVISEIRKRKNELLAKNDFMSSLGVPLRKKADTPETFAIPKPLLRTKIKVTKPEVVNSNFKPEPTIENGTYHHILKLINDVGKNFERLPSVYSNKGEEDLRDHIIMTLDPNFEYGSVTGETFNKTGKTDIQLRFDSSIVFIAECKFWTGEKGYLETIAQLLKYLTWRDTKASIIIFVKQKDFTAILSKVENATEKHSNYLSFVSKSDENWFNYRFHLNGDRNREIKLAVQLFHIP